MAFSMKITLQVESNHFDEFLKMDRHIYTYLTWSNASIQLQYIIKRIKLKIESSV